MSTGRALGWVTLASGALWLIFSLTGTFGFAKDGNDFVNLVIPIFGMITAILLIRQN